MTPHHFREPAAPPTSTPPLHRRRRLYWFSALLVLLVAAITEAGAAGATALLVRRSLMAAIPDFSDEQVNDYFARRNALLGWGPPVNAAGEVAELRPRHDPVFNDTSAACAAAYGESFTQGAEVGDDSSYPHRLGMRLGCRVANYGVGAYGSDQAFMLMRAQRGLDHAPVVLLGHVSENILRNVNRYRNLLYPGQELFFKPRFLPEGDSLRALPVPIADAADFRRVKRSPERQLAHDEFLSRPRRSFPYTLALARWAIRDFHVRARLEGVPRHAPFYAPDHPSRGLEVTARILTSFAMEARERGRTPLVVLIPVGRDLLHAREHGRSVDQPLADALRDAGVAYVHAGPAMLARLGGEDPCNLFHSCSSHFNERGYRMLAEVVAERLRPATRTER